MIATWWAEAEAAGVLPLDNRPFSAFVLERPPALPDRRTYRYRPGDPSVPEAVTANIKNRSHTVTAEIVTDRDTEGVIVAQGSLLGGWSLWLQDGRLHYAHNRSGFELHRVDGEHAIAPGRHTVTFTFTKTGELAGHGVLSIDDAVTGEGDIPQFTPVRFSITGSASPRGGTAAGWRCATTTKRRSRSPGRSSATWSSRSTASRTSTSKAKPSSRSRRSRPLVRRAAQLEHEQTLNSFGMTLNSFRVMSRTNLASCQMS